MKDELIKIAMKKVQKSGINSLTIRELGETVGIKSSSVMYHFNSKDGLIYELINAYSQSFCNYLNELNTNYTDSKTKMEKFIEIFEQSLKDDKFCLAGMFAVQNENIDLATAEKTSKFFDTAQKFIAENLKTNDNAEELADVIISSLEGALMLDKLDKKTKKLTSVKIWVLSMFNT